jgi:hypothetical protein
MFNRLVEVNNGLQWLLAFAHPTMPGREALQ